MQPQAEDPKSRQKLEEVSKGLPTPPFQTSGLQTVREDIPAYLSQLGRWEFLPAASANKYKV